MMDIHAPSRDLVVDVLSYVNGLNLKIRIPVGDVTLSCAGRATLTSAVNVLTTGSVLCTMGAEGKRPHA